MKKTTTQSNIQTLEQQAKELGAYRAKAFPARQVVIDERVRAKCQIPLCPHYGRCLTCPPNLPTVDEFRKTLERYETALLVQMRSSITGEIEKAEREAVLRYMAAPGTRAAKKGQQEEILHDLDQMKVAAIRLHKLVNEVEGTAMSLGFPYALGLIGGECMLCPECVGISSGKACRRPYEARPSMEGVGIDVYRTCINAGLPFDLPPKKEIIWSGLILVD
jgi:predicted metal-binding protein